jgi:probable F420-dependent oxidoreductase
VKFGLNMVPVHPGHLRDAAVAAETLGYESLWVGEHVVVPYEPLSGYPSAERPPFAPTSRFLEPFTTIGHLAGVTSTIRLGTGVLVLPLHELHTLARAIASADVLSNGRLSLGIGVGWMRDEFDLVGQPFGDRGGRADEMLAALDVLFNETRAAYRGEHYAFPEVGFEPKPVQRPHPPFLIGGASPAALRRAARFGDGWYGTNDPPDTIRRMLGEMTQLRARFGRASAAFEVTAILGWGQAFDEDVVAAYAAAGVHRLVVTPWASSRDALRGIEEFATDAGLAPPGAP